MTFLSGFCKRDMFTNKTNTRPQIRNRTDLSTPPMPHGEDWIALLLKVDRFAKSGARKVDIAGDWSHHSVVRSSQEEEEVGGVRGSRHYRAQAWARGELPTMLTTDYPQLISKCSLSRRNATNNSFHCCRRFMSLHCWRFTWHAWHYSFVCIWLENVLRLIEPNCKENRLTHQTRIKLKEQRKKLFSTPGITYNAIQQTDYLSYFFNTFTLI